MKNREKMFLSLARKRKQTSKKRMKIEKHTTAQAFCFEKVNIKLVSKLVDHY